jgi:phosphate:Na+ symporter
MGHIQQIFYFISGLAIFFFGQRTLSQGLQTLGGVIVKRIVHNKKEKNPLFNFWNGARLSLLGFSPTMSSMVVIGLANANLLKNYRILPMMMGTALGGSAILFVLSVGNHDRGLNLIAGGLLLGLILRGFRYRSLGKFLLGLGLVFLGVSVMEESIKLLSDWDKIRASIDYVKELSLIGALSLSTIIGLLLALSLTSSTMVFAIAAVLGRIDVFGATFCFGLAMGATLSSFVMTFITSKNQARPYAVRESFIPLLIMSVTVLIAVLGIPFGSSYVILPLKTIDKVVYGSFFVILLSFFHAFLIKGLLKQIALKFFPDDEIKEQSKLQFLGEGRFLSSTMAYVLVEMEVSKLMDIVDRMFKKCEEYIESKHKGARALAKIKDYERIIDNIQGEIDIFIEKVISSGSGEDDAQNSMKYLKLASSLEQLADSLDKLTTMLTKFYEEWELTSDEQDRLIESYNDVYDIYFTAFQIFTDSQRAHQDQRAYIEKALDLKKTLLAERESFAKVHVDEDPRKHIYYSDMMIALAKVRGHARDIYLTIHK